MFGKPVPFKQKYKKYNIRIPIDVQKARKFPIESLYTGKLRGFGRARMGICPFHEEKTPSFAIYPGNNSWYCFACGTGGDVIKFYQKLHGCSFQATVGYLSR